MSIQRLLVLAVILLLSGGGPLGAQSLADVAAKEEARRKQTKKASKVYTNKDVKPPRGGADAPTTPTPVAGAGPASTASSAQGSSQDTPSEAGTKPEGEGDKPLSDEEARANDEKRWRARIAEAREALSRNEIFAQALQSQINALQADFVARDDPAQRAVIETQRKKSLAQLDQVKAEIVTQKKAIADIEEEARRAGVPPGWLR